MSNLLTASALERVAACPASLNLPAYGNIDAYSEGGTGRHAVLDVAATKGPVEARAQFAGKADAIDLITDVTELLKARFGVTWDPVTMYSETSVAIDLVDGQARVLGRNRAYGKTFAAVEVAMTWDLLVNRSAPPLLIDWKGPHADVTPAAQNPQTRALAVGAAALLERDSIEVAIVRVGGGEPRVDSTTLMTARDIAQAFEDLRSVHRAASQPSPPIVQGDHCKYCPAFSGCPAKVQMIQALAVNPAEVVRVGGNLTPQEAAQALKAWEMATEALKRVGSHLYAYATQNPIPVSPGVVWGPVVGTKSEIDGTIALRVIEAEYGREVAEAACERSTSATGIERALKPVIKGKGGKVAPAKRALIEAIDKAGGVTIRTKTTFENHPAAPVALDVGTQAKEEAA